MGAIDRTYTCALFTRVLCLCRSCKGGRGCQRMTVQEDVCFSSIRLIYDPTLLPFDEARLLCEDVYGGRLTIPRSIDWRNNFQRFHDLVGRPEVWVGLTDLNSLEGSTSARRFESIEGEKNPFTFLAGEVPWTIGEEPNGVGGVEDCVVAEADISSLADISCNETRASMCEVYCGNPQIPFRVGACEDNLQLLYSRNANTFDGALADCEAISATLAVPVNEAKFRRMQEFLVNQEQSDHAYIGMRDFAEVGGRVTERFIALDGTVIDFTVRPPGTFPWSPGEPNDSGSQKCTTMFSFNQLMDDERCQQPRHSLCERQCIILPPEPPNPAIKISGAIYLGLSFLCLIFFFLVRISD